MMLVAFLRAFGAAADETTLGYVITGETTLLLTRLSLPTLLNPYLPPLTPLAVVPVTSGTIMKPTDPSLKWNDDPQSVTSKNQSVNSGWDLTSLELSSSLMVLSTSEERPSSWLSEALTPPLTHQNNTLTQLLASFLLSSFYNPLLSSLISSLISSLLSSLLSASLSSLLSSLASSLLSASYSSLPGSLTSIPSSEDWSLLESSASLSLETYALALDSILLVHLTTSALHPPQASVSSSTSTSSGVTIVINHSTTVTVVSPKQGLSSLTVTATASASVENPQSTKSTQSGGLSNTNKVVVGVVVGVGGSVLFGGFIVTYFLKRSRRGGEHSFENQGIQF